MSTQNLGLRISTAYGVSPDYFGGKDFIAARQLGASDQDILNFLDKNKDKLRGAHVPGGGGLYDNIKAGTVDTHLAHLLPPKDTTPPTPTLTVDPRIGDLQSQLTISNDRLKTLQGQFEQQGKTYQSNLTNLRSDISGFENQIGNYQTQITDMSKQLVAQAQKAKQFKLMDTQYLNPNNAAGIRLRRSKKFKSGDFALGTAGLNRKNRSPLKINSVNL